MNKAIKEVTLADNALLRVFLTIMPEMIHTRSTGTIYHGTFDKPVWGEDSDLVPVRYTELDWLCAKAVETLKSPARLDNSRYTQYVSALERICGHVFEAVDATWQQKAEALASVIGIKV